VTDFLFVGIRFDSWQALLVSAIVVSIVNSFIRPVIQILALPISILTLGIFALVINAAMLSLAAWLVPGFHIDSFWTAFWGAIVLSIVSTFLSSLTKPHPAN
jgi:putative membrane protein